MKGVITAGGLGTRLYPLTHVTNKHLLPVYNKPMIFYPIQTLVNAGIDEIMIVVGGPHVGHFLNMLRTGKELGIRHLEFAVQDKEGGIAQALSLAEVFAEGDNVTVILGDNTTDADISKDVAEFTDGARIFLKEVPDPARFGVPTFDPQDPSKISKITEKPKNPDSNFAVTGLYMYDRKVFDYIKTNKPSDRGELEITDVNNRYIETGSLTWSKLSGYWRDAGTFDTLLEAGQHWAKKAK
ncbi:spore coat protein [Candidatus Daviesbacteria bacterium RIFCSPHIGHO2_01_FULL_44_29]|uniref:glucose-1-phosphate thymidylyltransferase n=1 Tax=Candidatus Daviesbacteria bacterium RIFCSPHIGHO2_02_FULL_43_12 TaxID=1797776 RepID=A0A1F5KKA2_9BACT|nr:MAG: spore coat protein [Candidatus Daviesbacteria bacterium RIFCSPHIGHO2_01_FULL_44_29]OGE40782.1 MAG: spore coat protein [Candidatus Daviesbacteria bacterium RIFCSPHIGHO2_12_FULL_47_45]OGE41366.1 MAG: spore coat protein [Candidatus Daviesbacteria bacterium RIFCSPHIGHO2_02_FULL_43_12]OGE69567.1 MAG: spore coat protein [Candidatus Daviesbacteria bacterium RIFCSPLOWO2_01_FULL_43_15]